MKENIYYLDSKRDFSARKFKQMLGHLNKVSAFLYRKLQIAALLCGKHV